MLVEALSSKRTADPRREADWAGPAQDALEDPIAWRLSDV
jgi:hypothetical protein